MIAIIAILAGMLLPVLNSARDKARAISCINNQKQVILSVLIYTQDYNSYFKVREFVSAAPYYGNDYGWADTLFRFKYLPDKADNILCPSLPLPLDAGASMTTATAISFRKVTYGLINWDNTPKYTYKHLYDNQIYLNMRAIKKASSTMFGGDSFISNSYWGNAQYYLYSLNTTTQGGASVHARHSNMMNMMFFDGHAGATHPREYKNYLKNGDTEYENESLMYYSQKRILTPVN